MTTADELVEARRALEARRAEYLQTEGASPSIAAIQAAETEVELLENQLAWEIAHPDD